MMEKLERKIDDKEAKIAVIGAGYVGLPLIIAFTEEGFKVFAIEKNREKVAQLRRGESYIGDISSEQVKKAVEEGLLMPTDSYEVIKEADAVIITVPTPVTRYRDPDLSFIEEAAIGIAQYLHSPMLISLESTTYPGTTEEKLLPLFQAKGLEVGRDFFLVFSPERINPGDKEHPLREIPKIVGGITPNCGEVARRLYSKIVKKVVPVSNARTAEMIKLFENAFRYVNIAFANEMAIACQELDIDIWEVIEGAKTKGFGYQIFHPGPGVGGHCIPVDPHYLGWRLKGLGRNELLLEIADSINMGMPAYVVGMVNDILNERRKALNGSNILILGVSYKKDVADLRESPALRLIEQLKGKKANIFYSDPFIDELKPEDFSSQNNPGLQLKSQALNEETLSQADLVILTTDHSSFDYQWIADNCDYILDTRNAFKEVKNCRAKIYKL